MTAATRERTPATDPGRVAHGVRDTLLRSEASALPSYRIRAVHLTTLWAFSVSQPVFSILQGNAELLAVRGVSRWDALVLGVALALAPPLVATAAEWLVGRASQHAANVVHVALLTAFALPGVLQLVKLVDAIPLGWAPFAAAPLTGVGVVLYLRFRAVQLFLSFAVILPMIGLATLLWSVPVASNAALASAAQPRSQPPIVLVVFDELPLTSLLSRDGSINRKRFPAFAGLAADATWYPNTFTVDAWTERAVPAILTGRRPRASELPILRDHPGNLFSWLSATYSISGREIWTRLCGLRDCPRTQPLFRGTDSIVGDLARLYAYRIVRRDAANFVMLSLPDREERAVDDFLEAIDGGATSLSFLHVLLPHWPWGYLPSGTRYDFSAPEADKSSGVWTDDAWLVESEYRRHLLQIGYTDRVLGRVLARLKDVGLYDRSLVVVVADHGVSFEPGRSRRIASREHLVEIAGVPLLVKYPGQSSGVVDARPALTIDIVPTIADVLGVSVPWRVDGRSLLGSRGRPLVVPLDGLAGTSRAKPNALAKERRVLVSSRADVLDGAWSALYGVGDHRSLVGSHVARETRVLGSARIHLDGESALAEVDTSSGFVPARISGSVTFGAIAAGSELAIAVNGKIRSLARPYLAGGTQRFTAMVPESAFVDGFNQVDVFAIDGRSEKAVLRWVGGNRGGPMK